MVERVAAPLRHPITFQAPAVDEVDVEPAVLVEVEEGGARARGIQEMVLARPPRLQHARQPDARGHVHELEMRRGDGGLRRGHDGQRQREEARRRGYLAGAMCLAQAASTFFHSASRASALGSRASMASAFDESRNACLAALVTTT